ncbi:hypothetical protein ACEWY4_001546 [Coilia grayii]|uniref:C2H2-type domain-containing protein n=1 Tax=Coilia grayii TaxID=363190 RepID=A0ABD1KUE1_9TELE
MTPPKHISTCPVCGKPYAALSFHLRRGHSKGRVRLEREEGCEACQAVKAENARLRATVEKLTKELATVRRSYRLVSRRLRRSRVASSRAEEAPSEPESPQPGPQGPEELCPSSSKPASSSAPRQSHVQKSKKSATAALGSVSRSATPALPTTRSGLPVPGPSSRHEPKKKADPGPAPAPASCSAAPVPSCSDSASGQYQALLEKKGRANILRKIVFPKSIEDSLNEYRSYQAGAAATGRRAESAQSKVTRVRAFLYFLARQKKDLWNWMFMADMDGVRRYVEMLQTTSRAVTTANFYLRNVAQFLGYFKETKLSLCCLSQTQIVAVERCILKALRDLQKRVTLHQVEVKHELEEDGEASRYHFYGYFAAFVSSLYGHRPGVITNMLLKEVALAKTEGSPEEGYIINVLEHKTAKVFGAAQLYLRVCLAGALGLHAAQN